MTRFSIITVTFNAEKYLAETLSSTASQSFSDFEHILWDGGSKDRTLEIASKFPHVKIYQGKDSGISDAMNKGAQHAKGEFLLHLHADDLFVSNDVLLVVDTCLKQHPDVKWLYGQMESMDPSGKIRSSCPLVPFSRKKLEKYNIIPHPSTFISRALFMQSGGFDKALSYCMDYDLWLRLAKETQAFVLPKVISAFRKHEGSISSTEPLKVADEAYFVRNKHIKTPWGRWRSWRTWKKRRERIQKNNEPL